MYTEKELKILHSIYLRYNLTKKKEGNLLKISNYFDVDTKSLNCFDIETTIDTTRYLDPTKIVFSNNKYFNHDLASKKIGDFFKTLLELYDDNKKDEILELLKNIHEVNDTHLGESKNKAQGHGPKFDALVEAMDTISDIEKKVKLDKNVTLSTSLVFNIFVLDFGPDSYSDLITNIIYAELSDYTEKILKVYGQKMLPHKADRFSWNEKKHSWEKIVVKYFEIGGERIVLFPKKIAVSSHQGSSVKYLQSVIFDKIKADLLKNDPTFKANKTELKKIVKGMYSNMTSKQIDISLTKENPDLFLKFCEKITRDNESNS